VLLCISQLYVHRCGVCSPVFQHRYPGLLGGGAHSWVVFSFCSVFSSSSSFFLVCSVFSSSSSSSLFLLLISLFLHRLTCLSESTLVSITVCLPLMLQGRAPRFLNMGDRSQLPVAVYNRSPSKLRVSLAARCANARLLTTGMKVEIAPNSREGVCVVISPSCLPPAKNSLSRVCMAHMFLSLWACCCCFSLFSLFSLLVSVSYSYDILCMCMVHVYCK
jgi:Alpha-2-macroglobulin family